MTSTLSRRWFAAIYLTAATLITPAWADDSADVNKLMKAGQWAEANQKADSFLVQHPKDAQMRFWKGLILTEQNKTSEAITVFSKLTDDYPDLPEPYNNLAVLFAATNQYDKARAALEMAIRTNPTYGTAHENLGDVYAKLASQAYDKALQLDSGNSGAKVKLTLIRNLIGNTTGGTNPKASTQAALASSTFATTAVTPTTSATTKRPATQTKVDKVEAVQPEEKPRSEPKSEPKIAATPAGQEDILKTVDAWANAWSNKDISAYLAYYAKDFEVPRGATRKSWATERRERIEGKGRINVKIESPKVEIDGSTATVKFRQIYTSDKLRANSKKTLILAKQDGKWQIRMERTGN